MSMDNPAAGQKFLPSANWFRNVSAAVARSRFASPQSAVSVGDTGPSIVYARNSTDGTRYPGDIVFLRGRNSPLQSASREAFLHDDVFEATIGVGAPYDTWESFSVVRTQAPVGGVLAVQVSGVAPVRLRDAISDAGGLGSYDQGVVAPIVTGDLNRHGFAGAKYYGYPISGQGQPLVNFWSTVNTEYWALVNLGGSAQSKQSSWPVRLAPGQEKKLMLRCSFVDRTSEILAIGGPFSASQNHLAIYLQWDPAVEALAAPGSVSLAASVTSGWRGLIVAGVSTDANSYITGINPLARRPIFGRGGLNASVSIGGNTLTFRNGLLQSVI